MQTYMANPDKIERKWYVVDAPKVAENGNFSICRSSGRFITEA